MGPLIFFRDFTCILLSLFRVFLSISVAFWQGKRFGTRFPCHKATEILKSTLLQCAGTASKSCQRQHVVFLTFLACQYKNLNWVLWSRGIQEKQIGTQ